MKTPIQTSPYSLIQEELRGHPWRMLVACMMLNQTSYKQVRPVLPEFFSRWPGPESITPAEEQKMVSVIFPLGFQCRRTQAIRRMSEQYVNGFDDVRNLYGIGKYAADSYEMFINGNIVSDAQDKELRKYVEWALTQ